MQTTSCTTSSSNEKNKQILGFSLIELMVVLAVSAILITLASPDMSAIIKNNRIQSETDKIFNVIHQARQLAITKNTKGFLCRTKHQFSVNSINCNTNATSLLNWHEHNYMTYSINTEDAAQRANLLANQNTANGAPGSHLSQLKINQLVPGAGDKKKQIRSYERDSEHSNLTINTNRPVHVIAFSSDGTLYNTAPIYFAICDDRDSPENYGRYIEIAQSGRLRTAKTNAGATLTSCNPG